MANKYRAEYPFDVEGRTYTLRLSQSDLVSLEGKDELDERVLQFLRNLHDEGIGMRETLAILRRGLATGERMTFQQANKVLEDLPFLELSPVAVQLLARACGLKEEDDAARPSKEETSPDPLTSTP